MSTRANIILKDNHDKLWFYRHSDGYPEGTMPSLLKLTNWIKTGKIRGDVSQGGGWLIVLGALEYSHLPEYKTEMVERYGGPKVKEIDFDSIGDPTDWKVGSYEPTTGEHGDIEFLYEVDMVSGEIKIQSVHHKYNKDYSDCKVTYEAVIYSPKVATT